MNVLLNNTTNQFKDVLHLRTEVPILPFSPVIIRLKNLRHQQEKKQRLLGTNSSLMSKRARKYTFCCTSNISADSPLYKQQQEFEAEETPKYFCYCLWVNSFQQS